MDNLASFPQWKTASVVIPQLVDQFWKTRVEDVGDTCVIYFIDPAIGGCIPPEDHNRFQDILNQWGWVISVRLRISTTLTNRWERKPNTQLTRKAMEANIGEVFQEFEVLTGCSVKETLKMFLTDRRFVAESYLMNYLNEKYGWQGDYSDLWVGFSV